MRLSRRDHALRTAALRTAALAVVVAVLVACGGTGDRSGTGDARRYELPGDRVFPEGVAVDKTNGDFFVSSSEDGTVFRGNVERDEVEVFLPPGRDGRSGATGLKVDPQGRLYVAGRYTGAVFVHDALTGELLDVLRTPAAERTLMNDMTFTSDAVFVTDSFRPVLWRAARTASSVGELEPWLDLRQTPIPTDADFNLNGISASDDGRYLLTVHFATGRLFRIDTRNKEVLEVDLSGDDLRTGDGLLLDGSTLLVVREDPGAVFPVRLSDDLSRGEVEEPFGEQDLDLPTTLAEYEGTVLVVNSQFDRADAPELPFTVTALPVPAGLLPGAGG